MPLYVGQDAGLFAREVAAGLASQFRTMGSEAHRTKSTGSEAHRTKSTGSEAHRTKSTGSEAHRTNVCQWQLATLNLEVARQTW